MKNLIVGLVAVGAVMALRPVVKRHMVQMREHCKQMMSGGRSEAMSHEAMRQKMREHCEQMAAEHEEKSEPVVMA